MKEKEKRKLEKEIKKAQKKGIYNPKIKLGIVGLILVIGTVIGVSYAYYTKTATDTLTITRTVSKKITVTVKANNGYTNESIVAAILKETAKSNPNLSSNHTDKGLYVQKGDNTKSVEGKPTYYFRGDVDNNYLEFAGSKWRILRINEDNTVRIIKADSVVISIYGSTPSYTESQAATKLNTWYNDNLKQYEEYIAETEYCNDLTGTGWDRLHTQTPKPTYVCPSTPIKLKIGLITGDEIVYAGHISDQNPPTYLKNILSGWAWTMTSAWGNILLTNLQYQYAATAESNLYPVINLKSGTIVSGSGKSNDPYKVIGLDTTTEQTDYGTTATFKVIPNEGYQYKSVSCDNNQSATYNKTTNTLTVTPKTSKDVSCIVEFGRVRTLLELANEIKQKAVKELNSNDFAKGCPTSGDTSCSGVYSMKDYNSNTSLSYSNPGGTSYYFRGSVNNNYVKLSSNDNNLWRIVRVNGDGSIRLVLDGDIGKSVFNSTSNERKYVGYTYGNSQPCTNANPCKSLDIATNNEEQIGTTDHGGTNSIIKKTLEKWYYDNLKNYDQYIEYGIYCNDTSYGSGSETSNLYYGAYERLWVSSKSASPQLTCPDPTTNYGISTPSESSEYTGTGYRTYGGVYKLKIGLLSADEIVLAGFKPTTNSPYPATSNYLYYTGSSSWFWSSSPSNSSAYLANGFYGLLSNRYLTYSYVDYSSGARPVINLKTEGLKATGEGTRGNPYVISQ